ncbi:hypothetical protein WN943_016139 [Citrus x changshan-huyou]
MEKTNKSWGWGARLNPQFRTCPVCNYGPDLLNFPLALFILTFKHSENDAAFVNCDYEQMSFSYVPCSFGEFISMNTIYPSREIYMPAPMSNGSVAFHVEPFLYMFILSVPDWKAAVSPLVDLIRAAIPATCGQDIEVPDINAYPLMCFEAAKMSTFGAPCVRLPSSIRY